MKKYFLDANFFLDITDASRERHINTSRCLEVLLENETILYTSSDILTTVAYFVQKYSDLKNCVITIDKIVKQIEILCAINEDFIVLSELLMSVTSSIDYEDALQLSLAEKQGCDFLVTSDKSFCKGIKSRFNTVVISPEEYLSQIPA